MKYLVSLKGKDYEVEVERGEAILVSVQDTPAPVAAAPVAAAPVAAAPAAAPAAAAPIAGGDPVESPMPGVILKICVTQGQAVKNGDLIAILEAMKMENEIFAPKDGTVAQIVAKPGAQLDTGDPIVVLS
ncbi:MAG: acetyl-CoA carboxylase biotin carboxyl carrier protein subunit [Oscillospiraceae bacterium]|nr:acetyl-CoA carboxylase biotin carboxyl carrier protein subunit [Oscillospiraceae bacterium]